MRRTRFLGLVATVGLLACGRAPEPPRITVEARQPAPASAPASTPAVPATAPTPSVETEDLPIRRDPGVRLLDVRSVDPTIRVELKYATADNFTGAPLPGYAGRRALLRPAAARALARAQASLRAAGLGLLVYDAYRPVRASRAMVEWARRTGHLDLIRLGYLAVRSRHNLGVAVDLTLCDLASGRPLDMGTAYDAFSTQVHTANATGAALANRRRLAAAMAAAGFAPYDKEWWHFAYAGDPAATERYDVEIR